MSGHSKWSTIKRKKAKVDERKGQVFAKVSRELIVAARLGGPNPEANFRLKLAMQKAREANIPADNIKRAIERGAGGGEGTQYEELVYEGYGPGGIAIIASVMTDNRNRSAGELRCVFSKHGGKLGETGCVGWMFDRRGLLVFEGMGAAEDTLLEVALTAGASDARVDGGDFVVTVEPEGLEAVRAAFIAKGYEPALAEVTMLPQSMVTVGEEEAAQATRLLEALDEHDDVQEVFTNFSAE
ncbi:MAG: YebC/PmpR family DNA-binding transcriptional regulator [Bacillota bacterium]